VRTEKKACSLPAKTSFIRRWRVRPASSFFPLSRFREEWIVIEEREKERGVNYHSLLKGFPPKKKQRAGSLHRRKKEGRRREKGRGISLHKEVETKERKRGEKSEYSFHSLRGRQEGNWATGIDRGGGGGSNHLVIEGRQQGGKRKGGTHSFVIRRNQQTRKGKESDRCVGPP